MENRLGIYTGPLTKEESLRQAESNSNNSTVKTKAVPCDNFEFASNNLAARNNIKFSGGESFLSKAVKFVDSGGKLVEFCILDMISMIIPRTIQAFFRNHKELGHPNYQAGVEEAIREFLTGPSMFIIPMAVLAIAGKQYGKAAKIEFPALNRLSDIYKNTCANYDPANPKYSSLKNAYYNDVAEEMLRVYSVEDAKNTIRVNMKEILADKTLSAEERRARILEQRRIYNDARVKLNPELVPDRDTIVNNLKQYETDLINNSKDNIFKRIKDKLVKIFNPKENPDDAISKIANKIADLNKKYDVSFNDPHLVKDLGAGHLIGDLSKNGDKAISIGKNAKNLAVDIVNYAQDIVKKTGEKAENLLKTGNNDELVKYCDKLNLNRNHGRIANIIFGVISTGLFLYSIPKLYQRNKQYPGIAGLVKENEPVATPVNSQPAQNNTVVAQNIQPVQNKPLNAAAFLGKKEAV